MSQSRALDVAIEVGRERDEFRDALTDLRNRHGLLREALAAVRAGEGRPRRVARVALAVDTALAPASELHESEPSDA